MTIKLSVVHVTLPRPFLGRFAIRNDRKLALHTLSQSTKFEVSNSTHYEDMKVDTKYLKRSGLGVIRGHPKSLEIAQSIEHIRVPVSVLY